MSEEDLQEDKDKEVTLPEDDGVAGDDEIDDFSVKMGGDEEDDGPEILKFDDEE